MSDPKATHHDQGDVHERPEVKPLVEKAGALKSQDAPHGTIKSGADVPGGGGTKSLEIGAPDELRPPHAPDPHKP